MQNKNFKTSIGGQALIEAVMMRGPQKSAMSVRLPSGEIDLEEWDNPALGGRWYRKTPFVRGVFNMVDSMKLGYKCMMKSAEKSGMLDEEAENPSKFDKWLSDKLGDNFSKVVTGFAVVLGVILAVGLFSVLPVFLISRLPLLGVELTPMTRSLLEGLVRICIFVAYIAAVPRLEPTSRRIFQYHGAEHKTIATYEANQPLTAENVRAHSRFHPRCGTSFLLIVLVTSIIIFSVVRLEHVVLRALLRFALLPLVISIAYEIIKFAGRHDNILTRIVSAPGLWLQRLTSYEPDDQQIEIAISSMNAVLPGEAGADEW